MSGGVLYTYIRRMNNKAHILKVQSHAGELIFSFRIFEREKIVNYIGS